MRSVARETVASGSPKPARCLASNLKRGWSGPGSAVDVVLDAIENRHDFLGAEVSVQQVEGYRAAERPTRILQPPPGLGLGSQYVLGRRGHASHAQQPVRLVRSEALLLLPARQGQFRETDHTGQSGQGDPVAFRDSRQGGVRQPLSCPTNN